MATASKQTRGTKRTCQNSECGSRFYDLNSNPIVCPECETKYVIASAPLSASAAASIIDDKASRKPKKPELVVVEPGELPPDTPEAEGEVLPEIEGAEAEPAAAAQDETFLEEEEEDGGDMSNIIGGPVAEGEEEP